MSGFSELVKKANEKKKEEETKEEKSSSSAFESLVKDANSGSSTVSTNYSSTDVEEWFKRADAVYKQAYNYLTKEGYKSPDSSLESALSELTSSSSDVMQYVRANKSRFTDYEASYKSFIDTINALSSIQKSMKDSNDLYGKFSTEDEYTKWLKDYREMQELQEGANSEQGSQGWQNYLDDVAKMERAAEKEKAEMPWWERLLGYLDSTPDTSLPMGTTSQVIHDLREDDSYTKPNDNWSEEQKRAFGYLYLTDKSKAYKYATITNKNNNIALEEEALKKIAESATSNGWASAGHTIGSIVTSPMGLADYLYDLAMANAGRDIAPDGQVSPFEYSQAVTSGITEHLNKEYGTLGEDIPIIGGKGLGDVYGLGSSVAQSMASAYTLGSVSTLR